MSSVGRNDPCPCGSGKKYKKCCARKEQDLVRERVRTQRVYGQFDDTVVALGRWLTLDHPKAIEDVTGAIFKALYAETEAEAMPDRLEAHKQADALTWNGLDAALAYGASTEVGDPTFADLDAGETLRGQIEKGLGPRLTAEQEQCAVDLLASPMRLYRVKTYEANTTLVLEDSATEAEVSYPFPTATFELGDVFATRVVERSGLEARCMMGYLPIEEAQREAAIASVREYDQAIGDSGDEQSARHTLFLALWKAWLAPFAAPSRDAEESAVSVTDG